VTEAVRRTRPGASFLAIRHGRITSKRDDEGYDCVDIDPEEVAALGVQQ
jgi:hypothetical protein